jgi:HlyD family secretion protein
MTKRLLLIPVMALALAACHKPQPATKADERARSVRVVPVENRLLAGALAASGDLLPREEAAVAPEVSGYRVSRVLVDVGDYVKAGQTLVQLDPALISAQVAQAEAQAAQAEAQALQAESEAKRVEGLDNQGVLSQEQIDQRRFQARAARATATAQAANLRDARTRAGKLAVTAPVSGLVLERTVRPGDLSAAGATPWFRLARDGQIELAAQLSEDDLARVRAGQHATVTLQSGQAAQGVVRLVSPQIDAQTKLGIARLTLPVLSAWAIKNPIPVAVLFIALMMAGIGCYLTLPIKQFPNVEFPLVTVTVTQSGAAPGEMETQVTRRSRTRRRHLQRQDHPSSVVQGVSTTTIEFNLGEDLQKVTDEVRSKSTRRAPSCPATSTSRSSSAWRSPAPRSSPTPSRLRT